MITKEAGDTVSLKQYTLNEAIMAVAYQMRSGPWNGCWIKLG